MKILMVIPTFAPVVGGAERQLEGIAPALIEQGCEPVVVTRRLPGLPATDDSRGYRVRRLPCFGMKWGFHIALAIYILYSGRRYDVIHCHTLSGPAVISTLFGRLVRRPVLVKVTRSGSGSQIRQWQSSLPRRAIFRAVLLRWARFVAISADARSELVGFGVEEEGLSFIPNGVSVPRQPQLPADKQVSIIYTGRLIQRKRVDVLLRSFAESLCAQDCRLVVIGSGPLRASLEALASKLGISRQAVFMGELGGDEVREFLERADIFVLPSSSEGMSNSLLEAMASGLAVIATDIEANRELIQHGVTGFLFDDTGSLRGMIDALVADESLRKRLGQNARELASARHSFREVARLYCRVYASVACGTGHEEHLP